MSNFMEFYKKKKAQAGYNDSVIGPDLVDDEQERASSIFENLQYVSEEEIDLLKSLTGINDVVVLDDNENPYVNPIHLTPEIEAVLNRNRSDKTIPNNGPFFASDKERKAYSSSLEGENELLRTTLKKVLAHNQYLLQERVRVVQAANQKRLEEVARLRTSQVRSLATLMQRKGMIDDTQQALAKKMSELSKLPTDSFLVIKETVQSVKNASGDSRSALATLHGGLNTQVVHAHRNQENRSFDAAFKNLPWNTSSY